MVLFYFAFSATENKHGENFGALLYVADGGEVNETAEKLLRFGRYVAKFRRQFLPLTSAFFRATYPLPEKAQIIPSDSCPRIFDFLMKML